MHDFHSLIACSRGVCKLSTLLLVLAIGLPRASFCQAELLLDVSGIEGDVTLVDYAGWTYVDDFAISVRNGVPSRLRVTALTSSISAHMFFFALKQDVIDKVNLEFVIRNPAPVSIAAWSLDNARVTDFSTNELNPDGIPIETYTIDYDKIQYRYTTETGDILVDWNKETGKGSIIDNSDGGSLVLLTGNPDLLPPFLPEDFNSDGVVDGQDFLVWQRGGSPNPISATDLADWEASFGAVDSLSAHATAVPEPATGVVVNLVIVMILFYFRRSYLQGEIT